MAKSKYLQRIENHKLRLFAYDKFHQFITSNFIEKLSLSKNGLMNYDRFSFVVVFLSFKIISDMI